ncbi:DUF1579 domain-containing protein [bacterium]|nr:DUF1579 domain-containing protein [bacterium]
MTRLAAVVLVLTLSAGAGVWGQAPATPGPEHAILKAKEGTWETTMKAGGMEFKGTVTYKMELGGLWLVGAMDSDLGGQRFTGRSLDSYDAGKKKYIGIWVDSMSTHPMVMEGTYDQATKTLTTVGEGPGMDGKNAKWKAVAVTKDADTEHFSMYVGDGKEPMFTIVYKRKK